MKKDAFHREIKKFILEQNLLTYGEKVVVGVSGGPDSIALLHLLWSLSEEFNLGLHVAHINCMIRGVEAVEDAHYVREIAEKFDLPFTIDEVDLSKERGSSIQDVARRLRYKFLVKVAKSIDASKIAVAHHADDNAETIFMHLLYGCGQNGVKGIPPKRRMNGVEVVRPLLKFSKNQIIDYLDEVNLKWRTDSTNLKPFYLRNKIRLELLPQILKYNPNFKENLERLSEIWQIDDQYISQIAQEELERVSKVDGESVVINLKEFSSLHPALRRRILRNAIKMVKGNLRAIKYQHIASAERLVREGAPHGKIDLPNEIKVSREYETLKIYKKKKEDSKPDGRYDVVINGEIELKELNSILRTKVQRIDELQNYRMGGWKAYLDFERIEFPIFVRFRSPGDRFSPIGMNGTKKIKDFFIDLKISLTERDRIPLLVDGKGIIWVIGYRIDERVKVTPMTREVLVVSYERRTGKKIA